MFLGVVEVDISVASHQPLLLNGRSVTSVAAMRQQGREFLGWDHCGWANNSLLRVARPGRDPPDSISVLLRNESVLFVLVECFQQHPVLESFAGLMRGELLPFHPTFFADGALLGARRMPQHIAHGFHCLLMERETFVLVLLFSPHKAG